ncbi:hypothetical protein [Ectopseudomonas khazarica]|uniref:hypothetical protein n=1 Tax=Ectopseudomonas khazarica TaxID=2502979 RepID=UPI00106E2154|nr:hypothetical protein [Pseudomonas khazarica]
MKISQVLCLLVLFFTATCKAECDFTNENNIHESVKISDSIYVVFGKVRPPGEIISDDNYQISLAAFNCDTKAYKEFERLQYLASPGRIAGVLLADTPAKNAGLLFIIHATGVSNSATGVNYSSDYYSVRVYRVRNGVFEIEKNLTSFFGAGGDIFEGDTDNVVYRYPYKTISDIESTISKRDFIDLVSGKTLKKEISQKVYLHDEPLESLSTKRYLIKDDHIELSRQTAGWCYVGYENPKRGMISGWVNCQSIKDFLRE